MPAMRLPDLLSTPTGRLAAFFLLYVAEGLPLGFTAVAIATQMRRADLGPAEIGAFVGSLYLPWAFKWAMGPFVDTLSSERFGRRRVWIVATQLGMVATLLAAMPIDYVTQLGLFTAIIFLHNACAATMDVAIDALAVSVLPASERGRANGFMFAGAGIGQAIGGAGVLFVSAFVPFSTSYLLVIAAILAITVFVALPLRETPRPPQPKAPGGALASVGRELGGFVRDAWRAFTGTRAALVGLVVALLPCGAYALSLALQSNLAVELGLDDNRIAQLNLGSTVLFSIACVAGGWLSDRFGRRRMLALFIALTAVPTLWLAWTMWQAGWVMPAGLKAANRAAPPAALVAVFWMASLSFSVFQGLYYGVRSALFMDVTTTAVAATQFTAYMAMSNLVISYTAWWQGRAIERWGYPATLAVDAAVGLIVIGLLPWMGPRRRAAASGRPLPA
jgi:MFS transporter, PAT family, beta-lactamase induction signal transducer AmpG